MALVKFESKVGNLVMLPNYADQILKMIGHSGIVPSALLPEDIPLALMKLDQNLPKVKKVAPDSFDNDYSPSIEVRIFPFRELLKKANKKHCEIVWRLETKKQ